MLLGNWKNVDELEENLTLSELELIVDSARKREHRIMSFYAAFKGVDLDAEEKEENNRRVESERARRMAVNAGMSERDAGHMVEQRELAEFGVSFQVIE